MIGESVQTSEFGANIVIRPATINKIIEQVSTNLEKASDEGKQLIILTSPQIRRFVKQIIERDLPRIPIVSYKEISKEASIESIGVISNEVLV